MSRETILTEKTNKPGRKTRRFGTEQSETRGLILGAAEKVIVEEGYAAVTTRRVADRAGVKPSLVHYYFKTIEDLLIAVYRRGAERSLQRQARALAQDDVLNAVWDVNADADHAALAMEFMALANHRKAIAKEIARSAEQVRAIQVVALERYFREQAIPDQPFQALPLTVMLAAVARLLVMEGGVGISLGHEETRAAIEALLQTYPGTLAGLVPPQT